MRPNNVSYVQYFIIDTCVWRHAEEGDLDSLMLLAIIGKRCEYKIVVDKDREILREYRKVFGKNWIANKIFSKIAGRDKILDREKAPLEFVRECVLSYVGMTEFDESDIKFLQVAVKVPNPIIISKDTRSFLRLRERIKQVKIKHKHLPRAIKDLKILTPEEAVGRLLKVLSLSSQQLY